MKPLTDCPIWVSDETAITNLLGILLDKIDRGVRPLIRVNRKTVPALFNFGSEDIQNIWSLIERLDHEFELIEITPEPRKAGREDYENAKIRFNEAKGPILRQWLNRPNKTPYIELWKTAVNSHEWESGSQQQAITYNPLQYPKKSATEIVNALVILKKEMSESSTLRSLSAKCFWGDSKFLDNRHDYLAAIFPVETANLKPRKLLINVYLPTHLESVVFIENQDTFLLLVEYVSNAVLQANSKLCSTAFVYCAGFRGTARRIRDAGNTEFAFLSDNKTLSHERFRSWWTCKRNDPLQLFFWGDLDYSGLRILASLQSLFPGIQAWLPGYAPMVQYHKNGVHHPKKSARKENQLAPVSCCGCPYADSVLLPLIQQNEYFLDQEVVSIEDIENPVHGA